MKLRFTKMQGAGNDFVVLDATRQALPLDEALCRRLGDRRWGVGADQILVVERPHRPGFDFRYRIFNGATGAEVEHCGNGARCFARYVRDHGLIDRDRIRVETMNNALELQLQADGRVTVDMNRPQFAPDALPFLTDGLVSQPVADGCLWPIDLGPELSVPVAVVSMGNPHAVTRVERVDTAPVADWGPRLEAHPRFPRRVNVGFLEVVDRSRVRLRVFERDAGETLACGTGACAAVVVGRRLGWLDARVDVETRGGLLTIAWEDAPDGPGASVWMTGPASTVFEGEITL